MSWYTNPWAVGAISSVPGGFLVNWITGLVLGKKENREYLQKIIGANREVVYAVRPGISEGEIPSSAVLESLRNATARKYGVEPSNLYSTPEIAEELTKEVMDSSFISSLQKQEYCKRLAALEQTARGLSLASALGDRLTPTAKAQYRERLISTTSMLFGVLTVTMTLMFSVVELLRSKGVGSVVHTRDGKGVEFLFPLLAAFVTLATTTALLPVLREFSKRHAKEVSQNDDLDFNVRRSRAKRRSVERTPPAD